MKKRIYEIIEVSKEDEASAAGKMPLTEACGNAVIAALRTFPWGIQKMSQDMEGLVQTSLNPGILATKEDEVSLTFSVRSSVASEKEELYERLLCLTQNLGGKVNRSSDYPAWEYVEDSKLRTLMGDTYREMYKKEPVMEVIHAGVECGLFSEKMPALTACLTDQIFLISILRRNVFPFPVPREFTNIQ